MKDLYRLLDITPNASTAFHPQTDGQTERVNQELEGYLQIFINHHQTDWSDWLPLAEFTHNNRVHSATGKSPFMIMYGRNPLLVPDSIRPSPFTNPAAKDFTKTMTKIHAEAKAALETAAKNMKTQYDKRKRPTVVYQVGDKVWLDTANLHLPQPKKKLDDKRVGPFIILEKTGASAYKLKLPPHWKIHPRFNEKLLTPYVPPAFPNQEQPPPPPPDLIDEEEEYEVEEVLDSRPQHIRGKKGKRPQTTTDYFVKWKGWTREHNSWVRESEMEHAQEAVKEYEEKMERNGHVETATTISHEKAVTMILDHEYKENGDVLYKAQRQDGFQKWVRNLEETKWKTLLEEYWANQYDSSLEEPPDEP